MNTPTEAETLYCLHLPGPDDLYAAPNLAEAVRVSEAFNAIMRPALQRQFDEATPERRAAMPSVKSCLAEVKPWPYSADEHAEALAEWNPADWTGEPEVAAVCDPVQVDESGKSAPAAPGKPVAQLVQDATAEALRRALNALPRYSFLLDGRNNIRRVPNQMGAWIEWQVAHELFDPVVVDSLVGATAASPAPAQPPAAPAAPAVDAMDELRKAVAEIIGADPLTWPDHGNAPLAIAALIQLNQNVRQKADAWQLWQRKTEWVQEARDKGERVGSGLGHRADVMREEIELLRAEVAKGASA